MPQMNVADLHLREKDEMGEEIIVFYGRRPPVYAVYRTEKRVMVQFADAKKDADSQRGSIARLNPLRGEINGLIDGWRSAPVDSDRRCRADRYDRRVGDALVVAFEGDVDGAENLLKAIKADVLAERISRGRVEYLAAALTTGILGLVLIAIVTRAVTFEGAALDLWRAAAAGAFGAFFSISLNLRGRSVLPDLERTANIMDALLRVAIGLMAAAVLMGLIKADIVNVNFGVTPAEGTIPANDIDWLTVLIAGFVAGFSERFVPDLLAKTTATVNAQSTTVETRTTEIRTAPAVAPAAPAPAPEAQVDEPDDIDPLPEEAATDACASEIDLPDEETTPDEQLPAAAGGVEVVRG